MFGMHENNWEEDALKQLEGGGNGGNHKASGTHELLAAGASALAMREWQKRQEREGVPESFEAAKDLMAGLAGFEADRLIETKGLNEVDALRARHDAGEQAKHALANSGMYGDQSYQKQSYNGGGGQGNYGGNNNNQYERRDNENYGGGGNQQYGGGNHNNNQYGGERREERHHHERRNDEYEGGNGGGGGYQDNQRRNEYDGGNQGNYQAGNERRNEYDGGNNYRGGNDNNFTGNQGNYGGNNNNY